MSYNGEFTCENVIPGKYRVAFVSPNHLSSTTTITIPQQNNARIEVRLPVNSAAEPLQLSTNYNAITRTGNDSFFVDDVGTIRPSAAPQGGASEIMEVAAGDRIENRAKALGNAGREAQLKDLPAAPARNDKRMQREMEPNQKLKKEDADSKSPQDSESSSAGEEPRMRSYFPETLYTNPELITDANGQAQITVPMADSITTWRVTMMASTEHGKLGSGTAGIRVFQDFFVDLDLPVSLTQGDIVSLPVAVYNYLPQAQEIELTIKNDPWFSLVDDEPVKRLTVGPNEVTAVYYRIQANKIGNQPLTVTAKARGNAATNGDAISRNVEVIPNGQMQAIVVNDRLEGNVVKSINIPSGAVEDASKMMVKIYPGPLSQVVEGLDSILRMPGGCFEQTSSSTYPNVLVMDYLKTTKKISPEIQVKAEGYISLGYQRLVTFEVKGGGFSWFGEAPANKILTSYGLMEFYDMSKVHEVDPRVISRTQQWLAGQQQADGSFKPDTNFINEGATNQFNSDVVRITAYIGWALAYTGYQGNSVDRAKQYVDAHLTGKEDAYTQAVVANFAADYKTEKTWADKIVGNLVESATVQNDMLFWSSKNQTPTYSHGDTANLETTALAAQALIKWGKANDAARKALAFLTSKKDSFGNWESTQATILSLKAFLLAQKTASSGDTRGTIEVLVNGQSVHRFTIDADNQELMQQADLKQWTQTSGDHQVELRFNGKGSLLYQIVGRYYTPWNTKDIKDAGREPLSIKIDYDRQRLAQDDIATAKVTVKNNQKASANLVMVDLGIPPGFQPMAEDFQELIGTNANQQGGHLTKFTITGKQVILYFDAFKANQTMTFSYRLRAKYPIKAKTMASRVYEYYNPKVGSNAPPVELLVTKK